MHILPAHRRILLLTEGRLGVFTAKTAACLLRYRADDVAGLIDSVAAGTDVRVAIPWVRSVPILPDLASAEPLKPEALYVGVAPPGGDLPAPMRRHVLEALRRGIDVVCGLHAFLGDDRELRELAAARGARIFDLRRPPVERTLASGRARQTRCRRILTVGTDGNVGKMVAAVEVTEAARRRGLQACFVATGQTGTMIAGRGVAVDAVASDFAPGVVEELVLSAADADLCVVEGQGSLSHPGFSAVTLALLHGACPDALILVHHVGRTRYRVEPHLPIPPLRELCAIYEQVAALLHPARVVGVALNPVGADAGQVRTETRRLEQELRVPVCDPTGPGADRLLAAAWEG